MSLCEWHDRRGSSVSRFRPRCSPFRGKSDLAGTFAPIREKHWNYSHHGRKSEGDGPTTIDAQLRRASVVILSKVGLAKRLAEGRIVTGSDVDLAGVWLGVGMHRSCLGDELRGAGAAEVVSGEVEMVVLPVSEILPFRGVDFVGTIPADLQFVQVFAAAVVKGTKNPEACKRLIELLASE